MRMTAKRICPFILLIGSVSSLVTGTVFKADEASQQMLGGFDSHPLPLFFHSLSNLARRLLSVLVSCRNSVSQDSNLNAAS